MGPQAASKGKVVKCWKKIRAFWLARDRPSKNRNRERGFKSMPERSARLSIRWLPNRLELDHFEGDNAKRHLRKGYVWYLVQDGQHAPEISRYFDSDPLTDYPSISFSRVSIWWILVFLAKLSSTGINLEFQQKTKYCYHVPTSNAFFSKISYCRNPMFS